MTATCAAPIVTTLGLVSDIVGAVLVASEVVRQYHGRRFTAGGESDPMFGPTPVRETTEFSSWQRGTYRRMKLGLGFLLVGFVLQIAGTWLPR